MQIKAIFLLSIFVVKNTKVVPPSFILYFFFKSSTLIGKFLVEIFNFFPNKYSFTLDEINFVISYNDGTWDNNNSSDYKINISQSVNLNETNDEIVSDFSLKQNYPNPFNPSTKIEYSIKESSNVSIVVYHLLGQKVATLVNKKMSPGNYTVDFDASNLSSGVYLYKIEAGNFVQTKKMVLIK